MSIPTTPLTFERLAFVRYLYDQGVGQAGQAEPFYATAVLSFHDAVEQFLRLAADHTGISLTKAVTFAGYWKELEPGLSGPLPSRGPMERLNEVRVKFKHHGIAPSKSAIEQFRGDTTTFFTDAAPLVFGVDFDNIDMVSLVTRTETAAILAEAHAEARSGDLPAALAGLMIAFTEMIDYYSIKQPGGPDSPFRFGPTIREHRNRDTRDDVGRQIEELSACAVEVQQAMRMLALGIDYNRYAHFKVLAPPLAHFMDGHISMQVEESHRRLTEADYRFSRNFVIEAAIVAARAEAALQRRNDSWATNAFTDGARPSVEYRDWQGSA
ncbi:hypothetical protein [Streptomyces sp. NPDC050485]|uniref:hypothetical protein n=1 Tax=Streptomyces sp. NPDC050485 TaxID=3365617 RepID=UPI0037B7B6D2